VTAKISYAKQSNMTQILFADCICLNSLIKYSSCTSACCADFEMKTQKIFTIYVKRRRILHHISWSYFLKDIEQNINITVLSLVALVALTGYILSKAG
jgi:hypothetical protein